MGASERLGLVVLGAAIGVAVGFGLTYVVRPAERPPAGAETGLREPVRSPRGPGPEGGATALAAPDRGPEREQPTEPEPLPPGDEAGPSAPERDGDGLIPARLFAYAEQHMRAGWSGSRATEIPEGILPEEILKPGMREWTVSVLEGPEAIGARLAEEQNQLDAARAIGDAFELFLRLEGGAGPMPELVADEEQFDALFDPLTPATILDANQVDLRGGGAVVDGATLRFPAGVFPLGGLGRQWSEFPRDVTIQGAGRDATLLVGELNARMEVRNLTLRDMTFHNPRGGLSDLRRGGAVIALENLRLTGFDTGAGGSSAIDTQSLAVLARDCIFAGGYGRSPGYSKLFDVRTDALLARFDRCRFERMNLSLPRLQPGATVLLNGCALVDVFGDPRAQSLPAGVQLVDCTVTLAEGNGTDWKTTMKRDLNELFPGWEDELRR